jgi:hypothetical protein
LCVALQLSHNRKTLLKFLLRTIALSSYAPTGNLAATRPQDEDAQLLYASLKVRSCYPACCVLCCLATWRCNLRSCMQDSSML